MMHFLSIIFDHILDFADNTAIHGPRYISEKSRTLFERFVHVLGISKFSSVFILEYQIFSDTVANKYIV